MKIFSSHRKRKEPRRFGSLEFRNRFKQAANYKRAFNPTSHFSLSFLPTSNKYLRWSFLFMVIILVVGGYFLVLSDQFVVKAVTVTGNHQISAQTIQDKILGNDSRLFFVKKNNLLVLSQSGVQKLLTTNEPLIKSVSLKKTWPNKISVEIIEHTPGFVIQSADQYFMVDDEGVVVEPIDDPKKLLVVTDSLIEDFARGEALPNQKLAPFILSMTKAWPSKMINSITAIRFPGKSSNDVQLETSSGWSVLFDTQRSATSQLTDLNVVLTHSVKSSDLSNLAYVDMRLSKTVYYCLKESACTQPATPQEAGASTKTGP